MNARDFMVTDVFTCHPHDTLAYAASLLLEHDCGCLPVIDRTGRVGAVITDRDICMAAFISGKPLGDLAVAGSMSHDLVTCHPDDALLDAVRLMAQHQIRRLPVVDDAGKAVGLLSLNDVAVAIDDQTLAAIGDEKARAVLQALRGVCRHRVAQPAAAADRPQAAPQPIQQEHAAPNA